MDKKIRLTKNEKEIISFIEGEIVGCYNSPIISRHREKNCSNSLNIKYFDMHVLCGSTMDSIKTRASECGFITSYVMASSNLHNIDGFTFSIWLNDRLSILNETNDFVHKVTGGKKV